MQQPGNPLTAMGVLPPIGGLVYELVSFTSLAVSAQLSGGPCILGGWHIFGDNAVGFSLRIYDGSDIGGQLIATITLGAGATQNVALPGCGVRCSRGLYLHLNSGLPSGSFFVYPGIPS